MAEQQTSQIGLFGPLARQTYLNNQYCFVPESRFASSPKHRDSKYAIGFAVRQVLDHTPKTSS